MASPGEAGRKDPLPWIFLVAGVVTRIPFCSRLLLNMDSGQFALALQEYDVTLHQPHPPGYFLYVMLGRALNAFIADPNDVFISISVCFSGLAIAAIYLLGKEMFDRRAGVVAALLALSSPSLWFHGEVALSYIVEAFLSTIVALLCWRILRGQEKYLWISVVALAVAGGVRQNTAVFLFPLWLYAVRNLPLRKIVVSVLLLTGTCLLWFLPMVWMSGGWVAYRGAFQELWIFHTGGHGALEGEWRLLGLFSRKLIEFIVLGLGVGLSPTIVAAWSVLRKRERSTLDTEMVWFFAVWILPATAFYVLVFLSVQNPGYVLIFLPALIILASLSILHVGSMFRAGRERAFLSIVCATVVLNAGAFLLARGPVSYRWIRSHDRNLSTLLAEIRAFDPVDTAIFVNNYIYYSYRHVMVYLPEYRTYNVDVRTAPTGEQRKIFAGVDGKTFLQETVVLPLGVTRFLAPIDSGDAKSADRGTYERAGVVVRDVAAGMFIASGSVALVSSVFPEIQISFSGGGTGS